MKHPYYLAAAFSSVILISGYKDAQNGNAAIEMPLPYTIGLWDKNAPVEIELKIGKNVMKFHGPARVTVKDFKLVPVN